MTVGRLESEMSSLELVEWGAFLKLEKEDTDMRDLQSRAEAGLAEARTHQK